MSALEVTALVGTAEAHLLRVVPPGTEMVGSFEEAEGRDGWYTPWGGPPDTRSVAVADDGALYVNVHVGGIVRSRDGGDTWEALRLPGVLNSTLWNFAVHPADPDLVYAGSVSGEVYRSADGGSSWQKLRREFGEVRALAWTPGLDLDPGPKDLVG